MGRTDEMDTRGTYNYGDELQVEVGISNASLKKYSGPSRRRHQAQNALRAAQAKAAAADQARRDAENSAASEAVLGFSLKKLAKKAAKGVNIHKLNALAQKVGPLAVMAFPAAGPILGPAMIALNAADKKDPKAIMQLAATTALANSGNPEAQQAVAILNTARKVKNQVKATDLLKAAASGNPEAAIKLQVLERVKDIDPKAAEAYEAVQAAKQGAQEVNQAVEAKASGNAFQKVLNAAAGKKAGCECKK